MSTQRFMSHRNKSAGRCVFAILFMTILVCCSLLPATALARSGRQMVAFSSTTQQNYLRDRAGVSVVRIVATYSDPNPVITPLTCTGLGVLVASSRTSAYQNWVLSDGNLVKAKTAKCGVSGANDTTTIPLHEVKIWSSSEYSASNQGFLLGDLICTAPKGGLSCNDQINGPSIIHEQLLTFQNTYTFLSFQSTVGEPYLTPNFAFSPSAPGDNGFAIGLTNGTANQVGQVFPSATVNGQVNPQGYLTPAVINSPQNAGNVSSPAALFKAPEGGTPGVDSRGQLVGMYISNGTGTTLKPLTLLQRTWMREDPGLPAALPLQAPVVSSPQNCTSGERVVSCWNAGIDAFYGAPAFSEPQYAQAHSYLSQLHGLNTAFLAPQTFDTLALQHLPPSQKPSSSTSPSANAPFSSWLLLVGLGSGLLVLILLLILVTLLVGRAHRRRRELDRFAAEELEARRIAEAEMQRQRVQQTPSREVTCPNCHTPIRVNDAMCPYCRFPLSPTASGLNVRLTGNAPLPPSAAYISEQPTVQFPPANNGEQSDVLTRRQASVAEQETLQNLQPLATRNLGLAVGTRSDPGIRRKHKPNEDSLFAMQGTRTHNSEPQQFGLFVIADGMGGHANGQDASRQAIQTLIDYMLPRVTGNEVLDTQSFMKLMSDGVQQANQAVHTRNMEARADMGTTMTTALVVGATAYVANVGDSRTYLYRDGKGLSKVTNDHSVVASLVEAGIIKPDDIYTHPKRNQIYRSLGEKPAVEVDTFKVDLQPGDKLLLCSDGLWDMVRDPIIQQVLSKSVSDPNKTGQELIKAALDGGGEDNVSVIVAQFSELNERTGMTGVQLLAKPESVTVPDLPKL